LRLTYAEFSFIFLNKYPNHRAKTLMGSSRQVHRGGRELGEVGSGATGVVELVPELQDRNRCNQVAVDSAG